MGNSAADAAPDALGQMLRRLPYAAPDGWCRFVRRTVDVPMGCRLWLGPPRDDGYGQFWASAATLAGAAVSDADDEDDALGAGEQLALFEEDQATAAPTELSAQADCGRPWRAHRWAYAAQYGELPGGQEVMHLCDEPLCVRVEHLELGTTAANAWDRDGKGRLVHRGKNGVMRWGRADRRAQYGRSVALHEALTAAVAEGVRPAQLPGIVARADAAGKPRDIPFDLATDDE